MGRGWCICARVILALFRCWTPAQRSGYIHRVSSTPGCCHSAEGRQGHLTLLGFCPASVAVSSALLSVHEVAMRVCDRIKYLYKEYGVKCSCVALRRAPRPACMERSRRPPRLSRVGCRWSSRRHAPGRACIAAKPSGNVWQMQLLKALSIEHDCDRHQQDPSLSASRRQRATRPVSATFVLPQPSTVDAVASSMTTECDVRSGSVKMDRNGRRSSARPSPLAELLLGSEPTSYTGPRADASSS